MRTETELAQAQKLEAIGRLASGVAHEINTPTQYVGDNVRFLQDAFASLDRVTEAHERLAIAAKDGGVTPELLAEVEESVRTADLAFLRQEVPQAITQTLEGVGRVADIVRAMKEFAHPPQASKELFDLNRALTTTATVTRNEWKYVAEIATDFDPELPPVPCHPAEVNQVFLNILVNAAHAIRDAKRKDPERKGVITLSTRRNGGFAEVRISDTGTGIPTAVRHRIFEPFFTTKTVGEGTGQGLSLSRNIVVIKHQGELEFESREGEGTTFTIRLPLETPANASAQ